MTQFWGPFSAQIMPRPTGETKVAQTAVEFADTNGNLIDEGENNIRVSIGSNAASISNIDAPFSSFVLLPTGVEYINGAKVEGVSISKVTDNNNTNRQLVEVTWDNAQIAPGKKISANIPVNVTNKTGSNLNIKVFSYIGNQDFIVPDILGTANITDSFKEKDKNDIDGNGNKTEYIVTSGNSYLSNNQSLLEVSQSVKSEYDNNYSSFVEATPNSKVTFKLSLKNTTSDSISKMVLVNTLPSLSDKSITTHSERDSKYDLTLSGPIKVPSSWNGKVSITYSTSNNPKVAGILDKNTDYPSSAQILSDNPSAQDAKWSKESEVKDWSKIRSFKIEVNDDVDVVKGRGVDIIFDTITPGEAGLDPSLLDESIAKENRAAYNSFAISGNTSQVVEPQKVGVSLTPNKKVEDKVKDPKPQPEKEDNTKIVDAGSQLNVIALLSLLVTLSCLIILKTMKKDSKLK